MRNRYDIRWAAIGEDGHPLGSGQEPYKGAFPSVYDISEDRPVWLGSFDTLDMAQLFMSAMEARCRTAWLVMWKHKGVDAIYRYVHTLEDDALAQVKELELNGRIVLVRAQRIEWEE